MSYPFTNEGLVQLQEQLHQLNHQALAEEVKLIRADFSQWVLSHFELSPTQQAFLAQVDPSAIALYCAETAFAVENRLMFALDKEEKEDDEQGKIIWNVSTLSAKVGKNGLAASGTLTFYIRYTKA